ncbi:MAG: PH domain-containing protein [Actinomycetia bacterium]|nr:PH domain-containing protein [Actinomycetes bacterium]
MSFPEPVAQQQPEPPCQNPPCGGDAPAPGSLARTEPGSQIEVRLPLQPQLRGLATVMTVAGPLVALAFLLLAKDPLASRVAAAVLLTTASPLAGWSPYLLAPRLRLSPDGLVLTRPLPRRRYELRWSEVQRLRLVAERRWGRERPVAQSAALVWQEHGTDRYLSLGRSVDVAATDRLLRQYAPDDYLLDCRDLPTG